MLDRKSRIHSLKLTPLLFVAILGSIAFRSNSLEEKVRIPKVPLALSINSLVQSAIGSKDSQHNMRVPTVSLASSTTLVNYTTWKNDNLRTGQQGNERLLAPGNVNPNHFGVLFSLPVDGFVFGQPLYLANVLVRGRTHDVVFIVTEHDSVYAFDADQTGSPLWHVSVLYRLGRVQCHSHSSEVLFLPKSASRVRQSLTPF